VTVLGLNAFHGDSSAAVFHNGELLAAVEEERLNRIKHWAGLPILSARQCLQYSNEEIQHIAISRNPGAHLGRKIIRILTRPAAWRHALARAHNSIRVARVKRDLEPGGMRMSPNVRVHYVEHHHAHLASAFFASPFDSAAVASVDGFGDFSSMMWGVGRGNRIDVRGAAHFPHSLGLFYTAFTQFLGFPKYGDEYKMMGLSAYGEPRFLRQVRDVVRTSGDQCRLNLDYFVHHSRGADMTWAGGEPVLENVFSDKLISVFGPPRKPRAEITAREADIAASVQAVLEENYFALLNHIHRETREKRLCLAGGVALNCVANGLIFERTPFRELYVQPAANDAGTSVGAALHVWHQLLNHKRSFVMNHVYYGFAYSESEIRAALGNAGLTGQYLPEDELLRHTASDIAAGKIVGWFQGRMEFGPRALGNRSILADPRRKDMKDLLNARIKYREPFRPFCPSVAAERVGEYFETSYPSPFMVLAYKVKPEQRNRIPAVTHGDGTGRLQTVDKDVNPLYWALIERFRQITGVPVLLNTSFNENEPIVNTPEEAIECFLRTQMDVLVLGSCILCKRESADRGNAGAGTEPAIGIGSEVVHGS
jgi:carbamoyltransferase